MVEGGVEIQKKNAIPEEQETKQRIPVWLYPSTITQMERSLAAYNCKSKSEFIERAIHFYSGFLFTRDSTQFLSKTIVSTVRGALDDSENRMARLLFKLVVEVSMMMNIVAAGSNIDDTTLRKLRGKCVTDVKSSNGAITFDDAVRRQNS